ncbi:hypothetical protein PBRA_008122, partial [Plasmodiophora brassicae]
MAQLHWIEAGLLLSAFLDLVEDLAWVTSGVAIVLLSLHRWRVSLTALYTSLAVGALARLGVIVAMPGVRVAFLVVAVLFALLHPIAVFPDLSGPYLVGCRTERLRGIDCRILYPTTRASSSSGADLVPYLEWHRHTPAGIAKYAGMPAFLFAHLPSFRLRAYRHAPVADDQASHPLIVFSHGLGGTFEMYSALLEDWASRGFVVLAVNHGDGSAAAFRRADSDDTVLYVPVDDDGQRRVQLEHRVAELSRAVSAFLDVGPPSIP